MSNKLANTNKKNKCSVESNSLQTKTSHTRNSQARPTRTRTLKLVLDIIMSVCMLLMMGYNIFGSLAHEIVGVAVFVLFVAHHVLNASWHKRIFRGRYTALRVAILVVDVLVLVCMIVQAVSGIAMSKHVFAFAGGALASLPAHLSASNARALHSGFAYWGFLLVSVHVGLHWSAMLSSVKSTLSNVFVRAFLFAVSALASVWGVCAFVMRDVASHLLFNVKYSFSSVSENSFLFYIDYIAIAILCVFVTHYVIVLIRKLRKSCSRKY